MKTPLTLAAAALALAPVPLLPGVHGAEGAQGGAGEPRALLAAVPEDAVAFVQVRDLAGLRAAAAENAWGRMLHDPELLPFWGRAWAELDAELQSGEDQDLTQEDVALLWKSLQGSAVAFFQASGADEPEIGVMIDPGPEGRASFDEFLARVGSIGDTDSTFEEYAGVTLELWRDEEGPREAAVFDAGGVWCLAEAGSREAVLAIAHGMVDRLAGSGEASIEDHARLAEARDGSFPGRVELFVDVERILAALPEEQDEETRRVLDLLGLTRIPWVHGTFDLGAGEDLDLHLRLRLPDQGYLTDWFAALGPLPRGLAAFGPADSVSVTLSNVDLFAVYESIWDLVEEIDPEAYTQGRAGLEAGLQAFGGLDPERDLLAQITGEFASFRVPVPEAEMAALNALVSPDGSAGIPEELRVGDVFVVGLEDSDTVEAFVADALDRFGPMLGLSSADVQTEEFQGYPIQSLALPMGMSLQWCFVDGYFLGSAYPSALRASLELHAKPDAPSVRTHEAYAEHIEEHASASVLGLAPSQSLVRMLLGAMEMGAGFALAQAEAAAGFDNDDAGEETDWPFAGLEWPGPELARRYLEGTLLFELEHGAPVVELSVMAR
jgi:hypothetical protein